MPRKPHKYHYIYKTTCNISGNYYYGMHSTSNLDDGYLGSGKILWHSIRKYGKENHIKEILEYLPNREELKNRESQIVNEELINDKKCMNLQLGGGGGWCNEEHKIKNLKSFNEKGKKVLKFLALNKEWAHNRAQKAANTISQNPILKEQRSKNLSWIGKKHKLETKEKIGLTNSKKQKGNGNSQYGTCWITNGIENKKIHKGDIFPDGYKLGRK